MGLERRQHVSRYFRRTEGDKGPRLFRLQEKVSYGIQAKKLSNFPSLPLKVITASDPPGEGVNKLYFSNIELKKGRHLILGPAQADFASTLSSTLPPCGPMTNSRTLLFP